MEKTWTASRRFDLYDKSGKRRAYRVGDQVPAELVESHNLKKIGYVDEKKTSTGKSG